MTISKRNIFIFCASLACIIGATFLGRFLKYINAGWIRISANVGIYLFIGVVAWIAMKLTQMKIDIDFTNKCQYLIGAAIALALSAVIAVIPALCGFSLIGNHTDFSWFIIVYDFIFYLLIVGPVEEFIFRVYLQDAFAGFIKKHKWLSVIIAAFLFGLWHIINGSIIQVLFTFGIGLVFGFAKYKIRACGYVAVSFAHGSHDFLNTLVGMFIV